MASVLSGILSAIKTTIEGLSLSGLTNSDVVIQQQEYNRPQNDAGVLIVPKRRTYANATNERDDVTYEIKISVFKKKNEALATNDDVALMLQQISRAFHQKRITTVTNKPSICGPATIFPSTEFKAGYDAAYFLLQAINREART